ncbi:MAG: hypothetical protein GY913_24450 [Proteobacteria bacterium]|nr:hypothetical protein [Pseudomonadota bacterium]MCP4920065.1 hypothetical protein [Pseudomonadota bacterium]
MNARTLLRATTLGFVLFAGAYAYFQNRDNPEEPVVVEEPAPTTATLTLTLLDAAGQPPLDCGATLAKTTERGYELTATSTLKCPTGELSWSGLAPGEYRLTAAGEDTVLIEERHELPAGTTDLGVVTLDPGGSVGGVVTADGEPVVGAFLFAETGQKGASVTDGEYAISGLPVGEARLRAGFENRGGSATVEIVAGEVTDLDIALEVVPPKGVFGVQFEVTETGLVVTNVHPSGPMAGVQVGAAITAVDGRSLAGLTREAATEALAGAPGTSGVLTIDGADQTIERIDLEDLRR